MMYYVLILYIKRIHRMHCTYLLTMIIYTTKYHVLPISIFIVSTWCNRNLIYFAAIVCPGVTENTTSSDVSSSAVPDVSSSAVPDISSSVVSDISSSAVSADVTSATYTASDGCPCKILPFLKLAQCVHQRVFTCFYHLSLNKSSTSHKMCALCWALLLLGSCPFTHILQGYFTGTGAILWLPQCQWSNPD